MVESVAEGVEVSPPDQIQNKCQDGSENDYTTKLQIRLSPTTNHH